MERDLWGNKRNRPIIPGMNTGSVTTASPLKVLSVNTAVLPPGEAVPLISHCLAQNTLRYCCLCFSLRSSVTVAIDRHNKIMEKQGQTLPDYWQHNLNSRFNKSITE